MNCPKCGRKDIAKISSDKEEYFECRNPSCWHVWGVKKIG